MASSKLINYKKTFTPPKDAINLRDLVTELLDSDFVDYLRHMKGTSIDMSIEPSELSSEKMKMYAYYSKVILSVAMVAFTDMGWELIDKNKADEMLKDQCAAEPIFNPVTGEKRILRENKAKMPKDRLTKYITDCILFLEELGYRVPEAEEYKNKLITGMSGFNSVSKTKK